jgi:hypothetical protein
MNVSYNTQNNLLLNNLLEYYKNDEALNKLISIVTGESKISLSALSSLIGTEVFEGESVEI